MYPGTKYFIAREELKEIRQSVIPTWGKVLSHHGIKGAAFYHFNGQDNVFYFRNGSQVDLIELKYKPSDELYERFGSMEFTQGWCEEVGQSRSDAVKMISSRTGRVYNSKYGLLGKTLLTCNPKKNFLYYDYYKPWKAGLLPPNKAFIPALSKDNPYGEPGYRKKLEGMTGVQRQRLLLGDWEYDDDVAALIIYDRALDCFTNTFVPGGEKFITCDVARFGKDRSVIAVWDGFRLIALFTYEKKSTTEIAEIIKQLQFQYDVPNSNTIVDEDGVGGGVVDQLACKGFVNNSRPFPNPVQPEIDENGNPKPENYDNLKSQCSFRMAARINESGVFINVTEENIKDSIIEEMEQVKDKGVDSDKKKGVIPKEQMKVELGGRSPDYWDAIMMREYFTVAGTKSYNWLDTMYNDQIL